MDNNFFFILLHILWIFLSNVSSFGFDSSSCQKISSRRGRAQLLKTIPCDLTTQIFCNLPGSSYPWHAVRKFVHENQGLMKRMYGSVHQISILRDEIHNNDLDIDELEFRPTSHFVREDPDSFPDSSPSSYRKSKYLHSEYQNSRTNDILTPHFRPVGSKTTSGTTSKPSISIGPNLEEELKDINDISIETKSDDNLESNSIFQGIPKISSNIKIISPPSNINQKNLSQSERPTISTTLTVVQQITKTEINKTKSDKTEKIKEDLMQKIQENLKNINETIMKKQTEQLISTTESDAKIEASNSTQNEKKKINKISSLEGQLFQDTVQKESVPVTNLRGVNACPIKEEVVAPFWANNTRGEILALLNLYPFEQYVHFQKCQSEKKQMYCRDGCRCEQQYSLHRLLAYDPHDECRGIFSDWFRFPSCCVCKCYNIPVEFRTTSRSPRSQDFYTDEEYENKRDPIDIAKENVQRAIYEHATEDWYRPDKKEDFDIDFD